MLTVRQKIIDKFLEKLTTEDRLDSKQVERLRTLFVGNRKPSVADLVKVFTDPIGDDLK